MSLPDKLFNTISKAPRPFPGVYPTRVRINADGPIKFSYVGKPTPGLFRYFLREFAVKEGNVANVSFSEIDQNGYIRVQRWGDPISEVNFSNLYYPLFPLWKETGVWTTLFLLLSRAPIKVGDRRGYRCTLFDGFPLTAKLEKMTRDCISGRVNKLWFDGEELNDLGIEAKQIQNTFFDSTLGVVRKQRQQKARAAVANLHRQRTVPAIVAPVPAIAVDIETGVAEPHNPLLVFRRRPDPLRAAREMVRRDQDRIQRQRLEHNIQQAAETAGNALGNFNPGILQQWWAATGQAQIAPQVQLDEVEPQGLENAIVDF